VVPASGSPAPVAGASGGDAWWNSVNMAGSAHGGVGSSTDDDVVPGFSESDVPGFGNGGGGFGGRSGSGSGFMVNGAAVEGQGPHGRQQVDDWAYLWNRDGGGRGGAGSGRGLQWNGLISRVRRGGCY
jgi:hypothetical protein